MSPNQYTQVEPGATVTVTIAKALPKPKSKVQATCDPNYVGTCLDPDAVDYDCWPGSGNGPLYVYVRVTVVGEDHFELNNDPDEDTYGCDANA